MGIELILKIGGVGIAVIIINSILNRAGKEEYSYLVNITGILIILAMIVPLINDLFSSIRSVFGLY